MYTGTIRNIDGDWCREVEVPLILELEKLGARHHRVTMNSCEFEIFKFVGTDVECGRHGVSDWDYYVYLYQTGSMSSYLYSMMSTLTKDLYSGLSLIS